MAKTASTLKIETYHPPDYVTWNLGTSVEGRELQALAIGPHTDASTSTAACEVPYQPAQAGFPWIMFLSGLYGDEQVGVTLLTYAREHWKKHYEHRLLGTVLYERINPDAIERGEGLNANGVDLNHNFPTKTWKKNAPGAEGSSGTAPGSEPETKALAAMIEACRPKMILIARSTENPKIACDGPARSVAEVLKSLCKYPILENAKAPPGSLGMFSGGERHLPMISLGIPKDMPEDEMIAKHMPLLEAMMKYWEDRI